MIDGSDNPQCRYLVNDYLMSQGRKYLSGACVGWEAQITCYGGEKAPCYRCMWGDDQQSMGGCSTIGVVGMLPGYVGMVLGTETLKLILNHQSSLEGFLATYSGRNCDFKKLKLRGKKESCLACGTNRLSIPNYDYSRYGNCPPPKPEASSVSSLTWHQFLAEYPDQKIVDVRPSAQYDIIHFINSLNLPYEELIKLDKEKL